MVLAVIKAAKKASVPVLIFGRDGDSVGSKVREQLALL
jgi:hypothetical protein